MDAKKRSRTPKPVWAYAYQIEPPQPEERLRTIKTFLDRENNQAQRGARTWSGRVVRDQRITHILVVTDSPEQDGEVNRRLEAELNALEAGFTITAPMEIAEEAELSPATEGSEE